VFLENVLMALKAIWANKMRSMLTTLGIVIGTAAVIAVVSIVQGFSQVITNEVQNLGANTIIVSPFRPPGKEGDKLGKIVLTLEDGQAVMRTCPSVSIATPIVQRFGEIKFGEERSNYQIVGVQPVFQDVRNYYVDSGRFFSALDDAAHTNACVIGHGVLKELKLPENPIGRDLLVEGRTCNIIGVMEPKGQLLGQELDKFVMLPYGTAVSLWGHDVGENTAFLVRSKTPELVDKAADEIENTLRVRHRLRSDQPNDFEVSTQKEFLKSFTKFANGVTYVVAGVVSIALLVGGIGIMNIMLVSVTERTREIGVRKAVGARRSHILSQFVIEAITLALVGGIIGIAMGIGVGAIAAKLIPNWPGFFVPIWAVMLAFGFSSAVGLFFGIYPAAKASRLDPIESLRYE
jgi:putative ABC transport system permease protein